ncbi:DNA-binding protein [Clostridium beijerinckii]|uniref:DNA-binding protein n=2 Tax=Clostridium beijerinckii TaxID=1520 RepID=A0A0B5QPM3_CLOBE|nr:DNA-binding protein [Clostridium beijerinckii]
MNRMKILREELGLTVREVAERANVAVGYVSTLENDKENKTNPSKDVMTRIAKALESTVTEIFF